MLRTYRVRLLTWPTRRGARWGSLGARFYHVTTRPHANQPYPQRHFALLRSHGVSHAGEPSQRIVHLPSRGLSPGWSVFSRRPNSVVLAVRCGTADTDSDPCNGLRSVRRCRARRRLLLHGVRQREERRTCLAVERAVDVDTKRLPLYPRSIS